MESGIRHTQQSCLRQLVTALFRGSYEKTSVMDLGLFWTGSNKHATSIERSFLLAIKIPQHAIYPHLQSTVDFYCTVRYWNCLPEETVHVTSPESFVACHSSLHRDRVLQDCPLPRRQHKDKKWWS